MVLDKYNFSNIEKKWNILWDEEKIYRYDFYNTGYENKGNFVIDTPPPTISGMLHMGHVFSYCHADFIARYQRILGKRVFYPIGFDDNGLPTERLVEKIYGIRAYGVGVDDFSAMCDKTSKKFSDDFLKLFMSFGVSFDKSLIYNTSDDRCTIISQASFLELFNKSHDKFGDILYTKYSPCYWDCIDRTAISHAEVVEQPIASKMHYIDFDLLDYKNELAGKITIATTRPELMHACVAVLYNKEDTRYNFKSDLGYYSAITGCGIRVPIMHNQKVDVSKGTGLVMFCTFGDDLDLEWFNCEYELSCGIVKFVSHVNAIDVSGHVVRPALDENNRLVDIKINKDEYYDLWKVYDSNAYEEYFEKVDGIFVEKARKNIASLFISKGLVKKSEDIVHNVKCAERSGAPLEIIPSLQWYIKIMPFKKDLLEYAEKCNWYPESMFNRMRQWIDGLRYDWCISRQRFHGVNIPVWYVYLNQDYVLGALDMRRSISENYSFIVISADIEDLPINPIQSPPAGMKKRLQNVDIEFGYEVECLKDFYATKDIYDSCGDFVAKKGDLLFRIGTKLILYPEYSVMDTWATSALTPQINANGLNEMHSIDKEFFKEIFPADLRPQAHEIIRTWAFYTIVKSFFHNENIPWKSLLISGWCMAEDKTKMSKSKGNIIDPIGLINEKGADVVRYWASTAKPGADISVSENIMHNGKRLVNKIWNAAKFISFHIDGFDNLSIDEYVKSNKISQTIDLWLINKLIETIRSYIKYFEKFDYCSARAVVEEFFWSYYCDNYLEFIKFRIYNPDEFFASNEQESAINAACVCLKVILSLFAPFLPYVTEEIYRELFVANGSIHTTNDIINEYNNIIIKKNIIAIGDSCVDVLAGVRKIKTENNISIKKPCIVYIDAISDLGIDVSNVLDLKNASNATKILYNNGFDNVDKENQIVSGNYKVGIQFI